MKNKIIIASAAVIVIIIAVYFIFLSGNSEIEKAIKSLNAQNYEMAVSKLKEVLYEDEENIDAKALLLYAQIRKSFEEQGVKSFKKSLQYSYMNFLNMKKFIFQNKLNKIGFLKQSEKEQFLHASKNYRQQLSKLGIVTEDLDELEQVLKTTCLLGIDNFKLSQGDEVDQALYAFLLMGNSFFGNRESGKELIKLAKLNEEAIPLFTLCGENFTDDLKKELENDETLFGDIAKELVIKKLVQNEVTKLIEHNNKIQSAVDNLKEDNSTLYAYLNVDYMNNQIFFDHEIFQAYVEALENNNKAGIDIKIYLADNNIVCIYYYNPASKQYVSKFYNFIENELKPISFIENGITKTEFFNQESPMRFHSYLKENSQLSLALDKLVKKTGYRREQRYNPQKYYNQYFKNYTGGYDYVDVPYNYEDAATSSKTYTLNKDRADFVSEYNPTVDSEGEDYYEGD